MFFHETLPACLTVLEAANEFIDDGLVVVRDISGRLTVCRKSFRDSASLSAALKAQLGGYATRSPVVDGALAESLSADPSARPVSSTVAGRSFSFRFIDRRLVGNDWLIGPLPPHQSNATRLVFASLKGGVGRTTALTITAASLARQGRKVLVVDLDLEAPGVGSMLLRRSTSESIDARPRFGVIDYLIENEISEVPDHCLVEFVGKSSFADGFIDVLPAAGRVTDESPFEFIPKLSRALTDGIKESQVVPLWLKIRSLIERFEAAGNYDVVLVDARAGLAEVTASPLLTLGANIFLFGTDQEQTFSGYRYILSYMSAQTDYSQMADNADWRERVTFVQSKAPGTRKMRAAFRERVYDLCAEFLYEDGEEEDGVFNFAPTETGCAVPHDSVFVKFDPSYDAFDPSINGDQLDQEVYAGPFGAFLRRVDEIIDASGWVRE